MEASITYSRDFDGHDGDGNDGDGNKNDGNGNNLCRLDYREFCTMIHSRKSQK